jgi:hypothetical protein
MNNIYQVWFIKENENPVLNSSWASKTCAKSRVESLIFNHKDCAKIITIYNKAIIETLIFKMDGRTGVINHA